MSVPCPTCLGSGRLFRFFGRTINCEDCDGSGWAFTKQDLKTMAGHDFTEDRKNLTNLEAVQELLRRDGWFGEPGAYVLVDGQFGSTGKGLLAGILAGVSPERINIVTTNAGPNSGHTAYVPFRGGPEEEKVVTRQVPVMSVFLEAMGFHPLTYINAGAIIDEAILKSEIARWLDPDHVLIHSSAARIDISDVQEDARTVNAIASTGKGVGPALARKILRRGPPVPPMVSDYFEDPAYQWKSQVVFVETAQGFSLGLNSARFYPHVTSRECTVMQAISDARIPAQMVKKVAMCLRTYPIRVGNVGDASSGDWYPDQREISWDAIGVEPELTTVTQRPRRIATWSRIQFREAVAANRPDLLFLNFCNYLTKRHELDLLAHIEEDYFNVMGRQPGQIMLGYGPRSEDVRLA